MLLETDEIYLMCLCLETYTCSCINPACLCVTSK